MEPTPQQKARLRRAASALERSRTSLDRLMAELAAEGVNGAAIAREIGVSRQAVHNRRYRAARVRA